MQRVILIALAGILFTSCATRLGIDKVSSQETAVMTTFEKYEKQGFSFLPGKYEGAHKLIGIVSVSSVPGGKFIGYEEDPNDPNTPITRFEWHRENYSVSRVLDSIFAWSKENGANAISEFRIETKATSLITGLPLIEIHVSGLAIKRE